MHKQEYIAPPCPVCGKQDAARMSSTEWGHDEPCCSDECGHAYYDSVVRWETELRRAEIKLALRKLLEKSTKGHPMTERIDREEPKMSDLPTDEMAATIAALRAERDEARMAATKVAKFAGHESFGKFQALTEQLAARTAEVEALRAEREYEQGRAITAEQNVRRCLDANAELRTQLAARDRTIANMTASRDRWRLQQLERSSEVVQLRAALSRIALAFDAGTEAELAEAINNGKAALSDPGEAESETPCANCDEPSEETITIDSHRVQLCAVCLDNYEAGDEIQFTAPGEAESEESGG